MSNTTHSNVQEYYGTTLSGSDDLKTNACCTDESMSAEHKEILKKIAPEILDKYYGCGIPLPTALEGLNVLDLGSGTGRDVYLISKLVGESGHVTGIDMTDQQLDVARKYQSFQAEAFGYKTSNVSFKKGYIEDLTSCGIKDKSMDLVVSNCVINLSPDKAAVYKEIIRVLKPGGELYFSDVFSSSRVPEHLTKDPVLHGECLSGAMYIEDFRRLLAQCGVNDCRVMSKRRLTIENKEIEEKLDGIDFYSITVRGFKLELEDRCEDFGQTARYLGNDKENKDKFILDNNHTFHSRKPKLVCGNTADMLSKTRFKTYFEIVGNQSSHFGSFDCEENCPEKSPQKSTGCC